MKSDPLKNNRTNTVNAEIVLARDLTLERKLLKLWDTYLEAVQYKRHTSFHHTSFEDFMDWLRAANE